MALLYPAIAVNRKLLQWNDFLEISFTRAKQALANATLLHYPKSSAPTAVTVDASDVAIGAVPEQFTEGAWQPLAFFSRMLRKPETKYSAFDREEAISVDRLKPAFVDTTLPVQLGHPERRGRPPKS